MWFAAPVVRVDSKGELKCSLFNRWLKALNGQMCGAAVQVCTVQHQATG